MTHKNLFYVVVLQFLMFCNTSYSETTSGYVRKNGTYVAPYQRSYPNKTNRDNFSTTGNRNPYTGTKGYRAKDHTQQAYNYGRTRTVSAGPRGGQSYTNTKGNKVYVPKR